MYRDDSNLAAPASRGWGLHKSFGSGEMLTHALNNVSMELYPGQVTLLMGPSGSGKSTLLAVLSGLMKPDSGRVPLSRSRYLGDGRPPARALPLPALRLHFPGLQSISRPHGSPATRDDAPVGQGAASNREARDRSRRDARPARPVEEGESLRHPSRCRAARSSAWPLAGRLVKEPSFPILRRTDGRPRLEAWRTGHRPSAHGGLHDQRDGADRRPRWRESFLMSTASSASKTASSMKGPTGRSRCRACRTWRWGSIESQL